MRFVVITGPSGAGKTLALHSFEDAGYYAVDNLPPSLLPALADFCRNVNSGQAAVVVDTRAGQAFEELPAILQEMKKAGQTVEILFLDASDESLVQRYKETRRPHPLLKDSEVGIVEAVEAERTRLDAVRLIADSILDTSSLSATQLREAIHSGYAAATRPEMMVTITSFGFKYGLPIDADLVFDVRFLSNPHYVASLKRLDGRDSRVADYVHRDPLTAPFQEKMRDLLIFALPQYQREGKAYLNVAIGCTGGKHRSVVLSEDLAAQLQQAGYHVVTRHRDIPRDYQADPTDTTPFDAPQPELSYRPPAEPPAGDAS